MRIAHNFKDLTGLIFGRFTVLHRVDSRCKRTKWRCKCSCGVETTVQGSNLKNGNSKSCSCSRAEVLATKKGSANPNWKGGTCVDGAGYVIISSGPKTGTKQHRAIMEEKLGRELLPKETVHHKNGIRNDNRIENLELRAASHGRGQRVEDLVVWAKEILKTYEPEPDCVSLLSAC